MAAVLFPDPGFYPKLSSAGGGPAQAGIFVLGPVSRGQTLLEVAVGIWTPKGQGLRV